jgi:glycosyltransferase involved in cell wall biosynthesis
VDSHAAAAMTEFALARCDPPGVGQFANGTSFRPVMRKISVIMPAYNCGKYIRDAVDSVLHQTEQDVELIVVNDGSTDDTPEIVESIAALDMRVRVLTQPNSGKPSISRNRALALATGEFVCFLDADDLYYPDKIRAGLKVLQAHPTIDLVFHDVTFMNEAGAEQPVTYLKAVNFAERVISRSKGLGDAAFLCNERALFFFMCTTVTTILMSSVLIRRKLLTADPIGFPEDVTIGEDVDLWFRLVRSARVAYIDRPLSSYRIYPLSVTKRGDRNLYDPVAVHIRNYERTLGFLDGHQRREYRKRIGHDLYDIGYACSEREEYAHALGFYLMSLKWNWRIPAMKGAIKASLFGVVR